MPVQEVLTKLASLDADLSEKRAKKAQLEADVHMCTVKLDRAQKLISGLGGEKTRWQAAAARLGQQFVSLTGDIVLAAAQIAYLGEQSHDLDDEIWTGPRQVWLRGLQIKSSGRVCSKLKHASVCFSDACAQQIASLTALCLQQHSLLTQLR